MSWIFQNSIELVSAIPWQEGLPIFRSGHDVALSHGFFVNRTSARVSRRRLRFLPLPHSILLDRFSMRQRFTCLEVRLGSKLRTSGTGPTHRPKTSVQSQPAVRLSRP
jgi:hypothetical protein